MANKTNLNMRLITAALLLGILSAPSALAVEYGDFPSGLQLILDELYGREVGFPAYLAAGFVGYRMMDSGDHWASDVLFGAVLGWIVGHHIGGEQKSLELGGFEVVPYTDITPTGPAVGISLVKRF